MSSSFFPDSSAPSASASAPVSTLPPAAIPTQPTLPDADAESTPTHTGAHKHQQRTQRSRSRSPDERRQRARSRSRTRSRSRSRSPASRPKSGSNSSITKNRADATIFVTGLHYRVDDMDLFDFFSNVGRVEDIQLIKDPRTGKSKGLAYVEFTNREDAEKSQVLNGQLVGGYPITIAMPQLKESSAPKGKAAPGQSKAAQASPDGIRIYVGSLNFSINESDLRPIFEAFGPLTSVEIHRDTATGQSKGFGFISFVNRMDGETALAALDGYQFAGRPIKVGYASPTDGANAKNQRAASASASAGPAQMPILPMVMNLPLMPIPMSLPVGAPLPLSSGLPPLTAAQLVPSTCILIKNMHDPSSESDPHWAADLEEDVREEVEKFGRIEHIRVDQESPLGLVWIRFAEVDAAQSAQKTLHGRFFSSRQLSAEFVPESAYRTQFP